jgi:class 3 adenylate cyclase/tetratricopeptide (TPR) repeat protein
MTCPQCRQENPVQARFCLACGARLASTCAGCGTELPPDARFCMQCGRAVSGPSPGAAQPTAPRAYTPRHLADKILTSRSGLEGERKQVTVLFADLKSSMELLADRDPEEAKRILDPVLELMMEAVHRYEGTVNQVMGDGIMALFGAPIAHEDHAVRACYAALRMQDTARRLTEELRRTQGLEVQIRVGLNSGEVVVRSIGNDLRMDYTAVGQTTHLAARMEQLAPPGTVRLTAETLRLAEGFVQVRPLGPIPVKGLSGPVEVVELLGVVGARTRLQAARARGLSRFVGRDAEMEQLRQAAQQAQRGRGQVMAVVGEPGVGKSRLYYEFVHSHHIERSRGEPASSGRRGWLVLEASSVSYGKATPYLPLADLLRAYFRIDDRDDTRSVRAKVTGTLLTLDRALEDAVPAVLWLLDALGPDDGSLAPEPAQRRQRALDGVKRLLLRESQVQPLLLVFEDLHWIDAETQRVLDSLVESLPTAAILLAVNYRPEYRHEWGSKTYYRQARIDPLAPESADELLKTLLGEDRSVAPLKSLLVEQTEGNPLFLEESVRTLVETQALVGEPGAYRLVRPVEAVKVPPTVQAILAARIDRLGPDLKRLLHAASVIGKDVPIVLLEAIAEMGEDELRRSLGDLQTAEFLYEARLFPDLEYTFKHALTHEVAYGSLLQDRRRALHAAVVQAIERLHADRLVEHIEVLAHHGVRGGLGIKAARYLRQAGEKAVARSANREAIEFLEQALALLAGLSETPETLAEALEARIALGPALTSAKGSGSPEVEALYSSALELVGRLGDDSRLFPVLWGLWYSHYGRGQYPAAREMGERLLATAQKGDDSGQLLEAHHALWPVLSAMGQPTAAILHAEQGLALYERERHAGHAFLYGNHDPGACCRYHLALNRWLLGYPDRSFALLQDVLRLVEELKHPPTTIIALWFAGWVHYQRADRETAAATAERQVALATEHGITSWIDAALLLSRLRADQPPDVATLAELHPRYVSAWAGGAPWRRVFCLCVLADLYARAGHPEEALGALASIPEDARNAFYAPEIHRLEGELLLQRSHSALEDAERRFRTAIDLARQRAEKSLELRAAMSLVRCWAGRGQRDDARRLLADVYGWFTEGFETADLRDARVLITQLS